MSNEIQFEAPTLTGETLYAVIARVADGYRWETVTPAFEARNVANWTNYDVALAETNGEWLGDFPVAIGAGLYDVSVYQQASVPGDPVYTDACVGSALMQWDGTAEIPLSTILADTDALEGRLTAVRAARLDVDVSSRAAAAVCTEARLAELSAANLPADVDAIKAKTDLLGTGEVTVTSAVSADGTITLIRGDDYPANGSPSVVVRRANYGGPSLEGAAVIFGFGPVATPTAFLYSGAATAEMDGADLVLTADIAGEETAGLRPGHYTWEFEATLPGEKPQVYTPAQGLLILIGDVVPRPD